MSEARELADKTAIITGAARNQGRAFAQALARKGANIVVHYHAAASRADAEKTARLVTAQGAKALLVEGDLANIATVKRLFAEARQVSQSIDIVINNAGLVIKKAFVEITEEEFDRAFDVNAKAAFFVMQEAAKNIADNGRIINIGTTILGATIPYYSVYAGSKAPPGGLHPCPGQGDRRARCDGECHCPRAARRFVLPRCRNA